MPGGNTPVKTKGSPDRAQSGGRTRSGGWGMIEITGKAAGPEWPAAWAAARESLRRELGDGVYEAWIKPLTLESFDRNELRIGTTLAFMRDRVSERYVARIERALCAEGA